jgi:hypothetical protein
VHALLCPRLRRVRQRGLLKGVRGAAALALDGDVIRLTLQVGRCGGICLSWWLVGFGLGVGWVDGWMEWVDRFG